MRNRVRWARDCGLLLSGLPHQGMARAEEWKDGAKAVRTDFIDYPTGWELQRIIGVTVPPHLTDRCSAVQTHGAMLCDCGAIAMEWRRKGGGDNWRDYIPSEFQEMSDPLEVS